MKRSENFKNIAINLAVWLYTAFFTLCLPFIFLRLLYRSRNNVEYRRRWLERLGIFSSPNPSPQNGVWIHAVSVGETVAAAPIVHAFQKQFPHVSITVTTTTPTGSAQVKKLFGDSVFHVYFPYDLPWIFNGFLKRLHPKLCVIMETELWVNALRAMKRHQIPCMIINGRLSEKSMQGYQKIHFIFKNIFESITRIAAQSLQDGKRFLALGLPEDRLIISGNLKFDCRQSPKLENQAKLWRQHWGINRPVWIAASTHLGEEREILEIFSELKKDYSDLLLILVPRHPERFNAVADEIKKYSFSLLRRSALLNDMSSQLNDMPSHFDDKTKNTMEKMDILLVDAMGELPLFYNASDFAFVGGSLVPVGGHNTLEPAMAGLPSIVGPYTQNFTEITKLLKEAGALEQVSCKEELLLIMRNWLHNPNRAKEIGMKGKKTVSENQGAIEKIMQLIQPYF